MTEKSQNSDIKIKELLDKNQQLTFKRQIIFYYQLPITNPHRYDRRLEDVFQVSFLRNSRIIPPSPLIKGGLKSPFFKGDLGGSESLWFYL